MTKLKPGWEIDRFCPACGELLVRRPTESNANFVDRKTCGKGHCAGIARHLARVQPLLSQIRMCKHCGQVLVRNPNEYPAQFLRRCYCSTKCNTKRLAQVKSAQADAHYQTRTHKKCPSCDTVKLLQEFNKHTKARDGYQAVCRSCSYVLSRASNLKRDYGMTEEDYELLLKSQNGGCAICYRKPKKRKLNIDHNHITGEVRGLLCHNCNKTLGYWHDSLEVLERVKNYLLNPPAREVLHK